MRALPVLLLALAACHHRGAATNAPVVTTDQDALWKLAPDHVVFGVVASPRALAMVDHAWADVRGLLATAPELAAGLAELGLMLGGDPSLAGFGLTASKGGALFVAEGGKTIAIVPLGDRAKFLAAVHAAKGDAAACTTTHGVFACATDPALFDRLGKGSLSAALAGRRGDIELAAKDLPIGGRSIAFAVVAELARGAVTLHGTVTGLSHDTLHALGEASPPRLDGERTSGFVITHVKHAMAAVPGDNGPLVAGVTQDELRATIDDPVTAVMHAASFDLRIPLSNPGPARKVVIDHCSDGPLGELGAMRAGNACRVAFPNLPAVPFDLTVDDHAITVAWTGGKGGPGAAPTALGKELETAPWQLAVYGRGSLLGTGSLFAKQVKLERLPAKATFAIRAVTFLDELGLGLRVDGDQLHFVFGVRTAWSNPDDVVTKLLALDPVQLTAGKADAAIAAIVDGAPDAPLAADMRAGYAGLLADVAAVGVAAAVAIPAYLDYMKRAKSSPAELELNVIGRDLERALGEHGAYPIGNAALLPAGPCCGQQANTCAIDPAAFGSDPVWKQIGFVPDGPTPYQFRYHSDDGKTATVEAIGDVDCDGTPAVYKLHLGITPGGDPQPELERPPAGVY